MDATERALLLDTVQGAIAGACSGGSAAVDAALAGVGWPEMLAAEPADAVRVVFSALGSANASASVLDDVIVTALGLDPGARLSVLLPPFAMWEVPGRADDSRVSGLGLATARVVSSEETLVVFGSADGLGVVAVPSSALETRAVGGVDPDAGLHGVRVEHDLASTTPLDPEAWERAVAAGQVAIAHQISGACRAMLDLARVHALGRVQFGRPIARFQAVRHRLADALVAIEALEATLVAAADAPGPVTAALAKATAGRTARAVTGHCQQVLAGIGFTTDHEFHHYPKRTMVLEGLFGATEEVVLSVGRGLLAARHVPTLVEL